MLRYAVVFFVIALVYCCSASAALPPAPRKHRADPVHVFVVLFVISLLAGLVRRGRAP